MQFAKHKSTKIYDLSIVPTYFHFNLAMQLFLQEGKFTADSLERMLELCRIGKPQTLFYNHPVYYCIITRTVAMQKSRKVACSKVHGSRSGFRVRTDQG